MILNMVRVLFIARQARSNSGKTLLYCRVTVNRTTAEFSTGETLPPGTNWNQQAQACTGTGNAAAYINYLVDKLRVKIKTTALQSDEPCSAHQVIAKVTAAKQKPQTLVECVQKLIAHYSTEPNKKAPGTLRHYTNYLHALQNSRFAKLLATEADLNFADNFKATLRQQTGCGKTRASRHVEFYARAIKHAVKNGSVPANKLQGYEMERDKPKPLVYLTSAELALFEKHRFSYRLLTEVQDLFVYQRYTGVEYCNIWFDFEVRLINGVKMILGQRGKNKQPFYLPYSPQAEKLLKKYGGKMPRHCNSTYNKLLKVIAEILGIKKTITTHTARKTFAMQMKAAGYSLPAIQDMLGHESIRTTEAYYLTGSYDRIVQETVQLKNTNH